MKLLKRIFGPIVANSSNNSKIFGIDPDEVNVGDVLLTASTHWRALFIMLVTRSKFNHVLICVRYGLFVEAQPQIGITYCHFRHLQSHRAGDLKLLRIASSISNGSNIAKAAARYADGSLGSRYSAIGAISIYTPFLAQTLADGIFCSELVASAYASAGLPISNTEPHRTSPGRIARSRILVDVTTRALTQRYEEITKKSSRRRFSASCEYDLQRAVLNNYAVKEMLTRLEISAPDNFYELVQTLISTGNADLEFTISVVLQNEEYESRLAAEGKLMKENAIASLDRIPSTVHSSEETSYVLKQLRQEYRVLEESRRAKSDELLAYEASFSTWPQSNTYSTLVSVSKARVAVFEYVLLKMQVACGQLEAKLLSYKK